MFDFQTLRLIAQVTRAPLVDRELQELYQEALEQNGKDVEEFLVLLGQKYAEELGVPLSSCMGDEKLLKKAAQAADEFAYNMVIRPLLNHAVGGNPDAKTDSDITSAEVLQSKTLWMIHWAIFPVEDRILKVIDSHWPAKSELWIRLAHAFLTVLEANGNDLSQVLSNSEKREKIESSVNSAESMYK